MKYIKSFENIEDGRSEVYEIDEQFIDLMYNDTYIKLLFERLGMDQQDIDYWTAVQIPQLRVQFSQTKIEQPGKKLHLYFQKQFGSNYSKKGFLWYINIKTAPWYILPNDCDYMGHVKIEERDIEANKYNL